MRTTLTIEADVAARIEKLRYEKHLSLKQIINDALRYGIDFLERDEREQSPPRTKPQPLGALLIGSIDDVHGALSVAEGDRRS